MRGKRSKRFFVTAAVVLVCYLMQCTLFPALMLASVKPNLILIITASYGFMRGSREGMLVGFVSGLLTDIQFGNLLGFYALIYLLTGYINGLFQQMYYDEDIKLPLVLIAASSFADGVLVYILMFLLRSEFDFLHYLSHIIIPELIYTIVATLVLYPLILFINRKLETEEKRGASKFV